MAQSTTIAAYASIRNGGPTLRERAFEILKGSKDGLTADQVATELNLSVLSVRPQITVLYNESRIADTGERRLNVSGRKAIVWAAC